MNFIGLASSACPRETGQPNDSTKWSLLVGLAAVGRLARAAAQPRGLGSLNSRAAPGAVQAPLTGAPQSARERPARDLARTPVLRLGPRASAPRRRASQVVRPTPVAMQSTR